MCQRSVMWLPAAPSTVFHMNEYLRLPVAQARAGALVRWQCAWASVTVLAQYPDASSTARMAAAMALPPAHDVPSILAVLGDTSNASYPIYRFVRAGAARRGAVARADDPRHSQDGQWCGYARERLVFVQHHVRVQDDGLDE